MKLKSNPSQIQSKKSLIKHLSTKNPHSSHPLLLTPLEVTHLSPQEKKLSKKKTPKKSSNKSSSRTTTSQFLSTFPTTNQFSIQFPPPSKKPVSTETQTSPPTLLRSTNEKSKTNQGEVTSNSNLRSETQQVS